MLSPSRVAHQQAACNTAKDKKREEAQYQVCYVCVYLARRFEYALSLHMVLRQQQRCVLLTLYVRTANLVSWHCLYLPVEYLTCITIDLNNAYCHHVAAVSESELP